MSALIFIDLKRVYDNVNRNKLLLIKKTRFPGDILEIIKIMLSKSKIVIGEGFTWKTNKGLLQGRWLSPFLFNFYISPLLRELEKADSWFRANADDIVISVESIEEINKKLGMILK